MWAFQPFIGLEAWSSGRDTWPDVRQIIIGLQFLFTKKIEVYENNAEFMPDEWSNKNPNNRKRYLLHNTQAMSFSITMLNKS